MPIVLMAALVSIAVAIMSGPSLAQHHGGHGPHHQGAKGQTPYAGMQSRTVASLSDGEVTGILEGRGMGFALPAEINGYPGPMHVLELAKELGLTPEQRAATDALFKRMQAKAREAGKAYVEAEKALDAAFRSKMATPAVIAELVRAADARRAEKRLSHIEAHLEMTVMLSDEQRKRYAELRGYTSPGTR